MDKRGYYNKYSVIRADGKKVGRTFTIEIDKDPDAAALLRAIATVYDGSDWANSRDDLMHDLRDMADALEALQGRVGETVCEEPE